MSGSRSAMAFDASDSEIDKVKFSSFSHFLTTFLARGYYRLQPPRRRRPAPDQQTMHHEHRQGVQAIFSRSEVHKCSPPCPESSISGFAKPA